ncbi:MAG TPA: YheU family protein [Steroidobacteraceae bacterium]|nr:YheU family protein [Steroidobacteraceae bacterium]
MNEGEDQSSPESGPVEVPHGELAPETLRAVIESFVLREGTDYGERDATFDGKIADVMRQLDRREAVIIYDPVSDSVDIVVRRPATVR